MSPTYITEHGHESRDARVNSRRLRHLVLDFSALARLFEKHCLHTYINETINYSTTLTGGMAVDTRTVLDIGVTSTSTGYNGSNTYTASATSKTSRLKRPVFIPFSAS